MRNTAQLLLTLAPVIASGCFSAPELHLIPKTYQGDVFIVPNIPTGAKPQREGFNMVFSIPANGILVTRDSRSSDWHFTRFYDVDGSGNRQRLEEEPSSVHDTPENRADTRRFVWFQRSGHIEATDLPCSVDYSMYYVGTRADLLSRDANADELRFREYIKEHHVCP